MEDRGLLILCGVCLIGMALVIELSAAVNSATVGARYGLIAAAGACFASALRKGR